jgi:hypothetical protein
MPTYYNGKEITSTSKLSGLSLVGRASITIGGKVTTLSTPPPPAPPSMFIYGDSGGASGYPDPGSACMFAGSGSLLKVYVNGDQSRLFLDRNLTTPVNPGWYWSDDTSEIAGGIGFSSILVGPVGSIMANDRCRD